MILKLLKGLSYHCHNDTCLEKDTFFDCWDSENYHCRNTNINKRFFWTSERCGPHDALFLLVERRQRFSNGLGSMCFLVAKLSGNFKSDFFGIASTKVSSSAKNNNLEWWAPVARTHTPYDRFGIVNLHKAMDTYAFIPTCPTSVVHITLVISIEFPIEDDLFYVFFWCILHVVIILKSTCASPDDSTAHANTSNSVTALSRSSASWFLVSDPTYLAWLARHEVETNLKPPTCTEGSPLSRTVGMQMSYTCLLWWFLFSQPKGIN